MYGWVWSWDEHIVEDMDVAHYPDAHDSWGFHWITVYEYGPEGAVDEFCTIPLYTSFEQWRDLIGDREDKAQLICDSLDRSLQDAGG